MTINENVLKSYLVRKLCLYKLPLERADVRQILNANYNDTSIERLSEMISFTVRAMYDTVRCDKERVINYEEQYKKVLSELKNFVSDKEKIYKSCVIRTYDYSEMSETESVKIGEGSLYEWIYTAKGHHLTPDEIKIAHQMAKLKGFEKVGDSEYVFKGNIPTFKDIKDFFDENYSSDFYKDAFFNLLALLKNNIALRENVSDYFSSIVKDKNLSNLMKYYFKITEDRTEE